MGVLLLSLLRCSFLCDELYLCITIYIYLAAAFLSIRRNGSLSIWLSGLGIIDVVFIRAVLWAMLPEWVRTWKGYYHNINYLANKYGDKYTVDVFDILSFLPLYL